MTENDFYRDIVDLASSQMPAGTPRIRLKAYLSPEADYMSSIGGAGRPDGSWDAVILWDVTDQLMERLSSLRDHVVGEDGKPWLTIDLTYDLATSSLRALYGYDRPEGGVVTL